MSESVLSVEHIHVSVGTGATAVQILSDISLKFPSGCVTLIMGPSGSGKTTLLSVLGCLVQPQAGSVLVSGKDVTTAGEEERTRIRREEIGFVFQSFRLFHSLNALENVMLPMEITGKKGLEVQSKAEQYLTDMGLSAKMRLKPHELSGGEKQRVSIARALMREPKIILADEPTASLDSKAGEIITGILHDIAETQERTVVIVSHDERLRVFAKNIVQLRDGTVVGSAN